MQPSQFTRDSELRSAVKRCANGFVANFGINLRRVWVERFVANFSIDSVRVWVERLSQISVSILQECVRDFHCTIGSMERVASAFVCTNCPVCMVCCLSDTVSPSILSVCRPFVVPLVNLFHLREFSSFIFSHVVHLFQLSPLTQMKQIDSRDHK